MAAEVLSSNGYFEFGEDSNNGFFLSLQQSRSLVVQARTDGQLRQSESLTISQVRQLRDWLNKVAV